MTHINRISVLDNILSKPKSFEKARIPPRQIKKIDINVNMTENLTNDSFLFIFS